MDESPLLKLPPELRLCVYEFVLTHVDGIDLHYTPALKRKKKTISSAAHPHLLAVTQTCKQIQSECGNMLFRRNNITIDARNFPHCMRDGGTLALHEFTPISDLFKAIRVENAAVVGSVTVDLGQTQACELTSGTWSGYVYMAMRDLIHDALTATATNIKLRQNVTVKLQIGTQLQVGGPGKSVPVLIDLRKPHASLERAVMAFDAQVRDGEWDGSSRTSRLEVDFVLKDWRGVALGLDN